MSSTILIAFLAIIRDRYLADIRMLGLGEELVQVSAPKSIPPTRVAVQFDEAKKL